MKRPDFEQAAITLILVAILAILGAPIIHDSGPTFELLKADWECTESHVVTDMQMMPTGNGTMTPMFHTRTVCDEYRRTP